MKGYKKERGMRTQEGGIFWIQVRMKKHQRKKRTNIKEAIKEDER